MCRQKISHPVWNLTTEIHLPLWSLLQVKQTTSETCYLVQIIFFVTERQKMR